MAHLNLYKIMQEGNMPWDLTPFTRPSTYSPLYLYLCRVCGYYAKNHIEKGFLMGRPAWFELERFCKQHGDAEYAGTLYAFCAEDDPNEGGSEGDALRFLLQVCKPFIAEFEINLHNAIRTGLIVLGQEYYEQP